VTGGVRNACACVRAPVCRVIAEELSNIAGMGRGAPNQNPPLPPPDRAAQILPKPIRAFGRLSLRGVSSASEHLGFNSALPGDNDALTKPSVDALLSIDHAGGNVSQVLRTTGNLTFTEERNARDSAGLGGCNDEAAVSRSQLKALRKKEKLERKQKVPRAQVQGASAPAARLSLLQRLKGDMHRPT